jgi:hypothetical protein
MIPVETILGIGGEWGERDQWRGWIQIWYTWYLVITFANTPNKMCESILYTFVQMQRGKCGLLFDSEY